MLRLCYHTDLLQGCICQYLTTGSLGTNQSSNQATNPPWLVLLANFHGVNAHTTTNLKLPTWPHWMRRWEERHTSCSLQISPQILRAGSTKPLPRFHWWLHQLVHGAHGKLFNFPSSLFLKCWLYLFDKKGCWPFISSFLLLPGVILNHKSHRTET